MNILRCKASAQQVMFMTRMVSLLGHIIRKGNKMAGTKEGARKGKLKIIEKYGEDFYKKTGALGGKAQVKKGFGTNPELARKAGAKGGRISRRYKKTDDLVSDHSNS